MTSLDVRNNSAVMKRAEQLKRWEESDTNREPPTPRPEKGRRIKFSSGCVFLAACLSGDKEEVVKLLESGADINTANVDGLTALHQACIDDNLEMVEFLVEHGADINRQDNEGWTPLHATASCGFVSIARYLVEHGADVAAVNSDGDLAVDLAVDIQHMGMIDFMQKMVAEHNIDCEKARQAEEQQMLNDAKRWLRSDASEVDRPHPKTGATALHVAAAKGYTKVLSLLLAGRANVDKQDNDGWTPLHAAAHWSQKEASEMLVDAMADMDVRNYAGQSCIDVAERKMVKFLEELRANNKRMKRRPSSQISSSRISDTIENHIENTAAKLVRVEVRPDPSKDQANASQLVTKRENDSSDVECDDDTVGDGSTCADNVDERDGADCDVDDGGGGGDGSGGGDGGDSSSQNLSKVVESDDTDSDLTDSTESSHSTSISEAEDEKTHQPADSFINQNQQQKKETTSNEEEAPWRRNSSTTRVRIQPETPAKNQVPEKDVKNSTTSNEVSDVILRRTQSFENDEKFYQKYNELRARIKANSCPILPATLTNNNPSVLGTANTTNQNFSVQRSASLKDQRNFRKPATVPTTTGPAVTPTTTTNAVSVAINTTPVRRSFVPPVRDEESETQRKAHAKRVRETRRSTQGVTLDEIKSAEELVKKKNSAMNNNNNNSNNNNNNGSSFKLEEVSSGNTYSPTNSAIIPSAPAVIAAANLSSSVAQRRINSTGNAINSSTQSLNSIGRPVSAPIGGVSSASSANNIAESHINDRNSDSSTSIGSYASRRLNNLTSTFSTPATTTNNSSSTTTASVTMGANVPPSISSLAKSGEDKENDKENDRSSVTTQAVLQRRRKPKRRSTGVVHLDMDDLDPERQDANAESEEKESGSECASRSRLGSTSSSTAAAPATDDNKSRERSENGGNNIDYKALWEALKVENEKLKSQLKKKDDEVVQSRATLEKITNATTKNSLSEIEKRERRAMERKLSEMEEELKQLEVYKTENQRLKEENGALIRVLLFLRSTEFKIFSSKIEFKLFIAEKLFGNNLKQNSSQTKTSRVKNAKKIQNVVVFN